MFSARYVRSISLIMLATLMLTACGGKSAASSSDWSSATSAANGGGMDALVAAAKAEGELNVIALPEDWCNYGEMISTFESKYGIKVNSITPEAGSRRRSSSYHRQQREQRPSIP